MPKQDEIKKLAGKVSTLGMGFMRDTEARNKAVPFVQKTVEFSQQIQNTFEAIPQYFEAQDWNSVFTNHLGRAAITLPQFRLGQGHCTRRFRARPCPIPQVLP